MPYILIVTFSSIVLFLNLEGDKKHGRILIVVAVAYIIALIVFIGGFRENVGADFRGYVSYFHKTPAFGKEFFADGFPGVDIGFSLLISVIKLIGFTEPYALFVPTIVLATSLNYFSFRRYSKYFLVSLFLYLCLYFFGREMGQIRMGLATSLSFFAMRYVVDRDFKRFVVFWLLSVSVHAAMIVVLPLYFLGHRSFPRIGYIIFLILALIIREVDIIGRFLQSFGITGLRGAHYLDTEFAEDLSLLSIEYLRRFLPVVLGFIGLRVLQKRHRYFLVAYNSLVYGFCISLAFGKVGHIFATRLPAALIFSEVLILGFILDYFKSKPLRIAYLIAIWFYGLFFLLNLFEHRFTNFFPYGNYLF